MIYLNIVLYASVSIQVEVKVIAPSLNPPFFDKDGEVVHIDEGQELNTTVATIVATVPDPGTAYYWKALKHACMVWAAQRMVRLILSVTYMCHL